MSGSWEALNEPPVAIESNIAFIDAENFVFASSVSSKNNLKSNCSNAGIFNYNITNNKWTLLAKYPHHASVVPTSFHSICYDADNPRIFIQGYEKKLIIYNCNPQTWNVHPLNIQIGSFTHLLVVNGELNVIGGASNKYHLIWDKNTKQFKQIFKFYEWESGNYGAGLVYLHSSKTLMLVGGYDFITFNRLKSIWMHKIKTSEWNKLNVTLPYKLYMFAYVLTLDDKFLITFGGETQDKESMGHAQNLDDIWILDIVQTKWRRSKVKCPSEDIYYAVLMSNKVNATLLVYGWIRYLLNVPILPMDIMDLITGWYCIESIHLFSRNHTEHWQMELDQILN